MSECLSINDLRHLGVHAFHFADEKTEASKGSDDFPRTTREFECRAGEGAER